MGVRVLSITFLFFLIQPFLFSSFNPRSCANVAVFCSPLTGLIPVVVVVVCGWNMAEPHQRPLVAETCLLLCLLSGGLTHPDPRQRDALIQLEASMQLGGQVELNDAERRLDSVLKEMKLEELRRADFPPAMHFFKAEPLIRTSPIFKVLQKMPKGALCETLLYDFSLPFAHVSHGDVHFVNRP